MLYKDPFERDKNYSRLNTKRPPFRMFIGNEHISRS